MTTLPAGPSFTESDVVRVAKAIDRRPPGQRDEPRKCGYRNRSPKNVGRADVRWILRTDRMPNGRWLSVLIAGGPHQVTLAEYGSEDEARTGHTGLVERLPEIVTEAMRDNRANQ